ncbi:MAG: hypothetical protein GIX02_01605 [Candidatus Eremiobacteraeota bacterium]|nr:hypothetical protein [Candidatus Eremiobacteraeota bacterium]
MTAKALISIALFAVLASTQAHAATPPAGAFILNAVRTDIPPPLVASPDAPQWQRAGSATLKWDFTFHRAATERTTVRLLYDARYVYILCVAKQKSPVVATQHTNDVGDDLDDNFAVNLWPSGPNGLRYKFTSTAIGTRYQESSENESYAPQWDAVGRIDKDGFTIMMRIRLDVMRGDGREEWRINFQRLRQKTGELFIWATDPAMTEDDQGQHAGYLRGVIGISQTTRTRPRVSFYELGTLVSQSVGGSTSRMGVDVALPVSRGSSVLLTAHPDYSNVELDQQAIQPTEFVRVLQEVRPFFVQGALYYNIFDQIGNTNNIMLYTPNIPTPRVGEAIEGHEGNVNYAGFNSVSNGSTDAADAVFWNSSDKRWRAGYQRVAVAQADFYDLAQAATLRYDNLRNFYTYLSYGTDRGTNVTEPKLGNWEETGAGIYSPTSKLAAGIRKIGPQYTPADGIVDHPDIAGYAIEGFRRYDFTAKSWLQSIELSGDLERYKDVQGKNSPTCPTGAFCPLLFRTNQADQSLDVAIAAKNLFTLGFTTGSHFLLPADAPGGLFDENVIGLTYNANSATPLSLVHTSGSFAGGFLQTWLRNAAFRVGQRAVVDIESDSSRYVTPDRQFFSQDLVRTGLTMLLTRQDSLSAGIRRVVGDGPNIGGGIQIAPGSNASFAFHHRSAHAEVYFAYGDANAEFTYPALTLKLIQYFGAEKGS